MSLKLLTEEINQLIADAGQEDPDSEKRIELIKTAPRRTCQLFMQLLHDAEGLILERLQKAKLASGEEAVLLISIWATILYMPYRNGRR